MSQNFAKLVFPRLLASFLGLLIVLACLEGGLRLLGADTTTRPFPYKFDKTIRVLCIGDSTTKRQYPEFLQKELENLIPGKEFEVFDKGQPGVNSTFLVKEFKNNILTIKPDIVVAMIGCNDTKELFLRFGHIKSPKHMWLIQNIKTYALFYFLITQSIAEPTMLDPSPDLKSPAPRTLTEQEQKAVDTRNQTTDTQTIHISKHFEEHQHLLESENFDLFFNTQGFMENCNKNTPDTLYHIKTISTKFLSGYLNPKGKNFKIRFKNLEQYLLQSPNTPIANKLLLYRLYEKTGQFAKMAAIGKQLWEQNPENFEILLEIICSNTQPDNARLKQILKQTWLKHISAKTKDPGNDDYASSMYFDSKVMENTDLKLSVIADKLEQALRVFPDEDNIYKFLVNVYLHQNNFSDILSLYGFYQRYYTNKEKSNLEDFWQQILLLHAPLKRVVFHAFNSPLLRKNYHRIAGMCKKHDIPLFAMQYPMVEANTLQHILEDFSNVIIVSNEKQFKRMVGRHGYAKYFVDNFGGCFGHATDEGNRLIAQNLAKSIKKYLRRAKAKHPA